MPYALAALCLLLAWYWWAQRRRRVLLLDFACYKPPEELKVTKPRFMAGLKDVKVGQATCSHAGACLPEQILVRPKSAALLCFAVGLLHCDRQSKEEKMLLLFCKQQMMEDGLRIQYASSAIHALGFASRVIFR